MTLRAAAPLALLWVFLVAVYWLTMPPDITFEDTPLFAGVCSSLGLAHPPGYPAHTLFCTPFAKALHALSFPYARGAALASALAAARAATLLAWLLARMSGSLPAGLLAAGAWGLSPSLWGQAQIPEVYGLNALLVVATMACAHLYAAGGSRRWLAAMALVTGLGLANHWPLYVITYPAFLFMLAPSWRGVLRDLSRPGFFASCLLSLLAGLSPYLHLLTVSAESFRFDTEHVPGNFIPYVSREVYGLGGEPISLHERVKAASESVLFFVGELHYVFGLLAVVGLALIVAKRDWWLLFAVTWGMLSTTALLAAVRPFEFASPILRWVFSVYPIGSYAFAAIPLALALAWGFARYRVDGRAAAALAAAALVAVSWTRWDAMDRGDEDIALPSARLVLGSVPSDGLVIRTSGDLSFPITFAHFLLSEGDRPDVVGELDYFESLNSDGTLPRDEEERLGSVGRPVAYVLKLELKTLGQRFHGLSYTIDPGVPAGEVEVDVRPEAREVLADMLALHREGVRNTFTRVFIEQSLVSYATELQVAGQSGKELPEEDMRLLGDVLQTPLGQYSRFLVKTLHAQEPVTRATIELLAIEIEPFLALLSPQRRVDIMHLVAVGRVQAGDIEGGLALLESALGQWPNNGNSRVIVDILQIYALQGRFEDYLRLRRAYPGADTGAALDKTDAECAEALGGGCAP